jgi:hypothetical protein
MRPEAARRSGTLPPVVPGEPLANDLHVPLALLDVGHVRRLLEQNPLGVGDAALERLLQRRRRFVVAA